MSRAANSSLRACATPSGTAGLPPGERIARGGDRALSRGQPHARAGRAAAAAAARPAGRRRKPQPGRRRAEPASGARALRHARDPRRFGRKICGPACQRSRDRHPLIASSTEFGMHADDARMLISLNRRFHRAICEAAHNRYLIADARQLHDSLALLHSNDLSTAEPQNRVGRGAPPHRARDRTAQRGRGRAGGAQSCPRRTAYTLLCSGRLARLASAPAALGGGPTRAAGRAPTWRGCGRRAPCSNAPRSGRCRVATTACKHR